MPEENNLCCNAGTITLNQKGYFGTYPEAMWYNPHGIANIISLSNASKYYTITLDQQGFRLSTGNGSELLFWPNLQGLYQYHIPTNSTPDIWAFVQTVKNKMEGYTPREINRAKLARRLQNIIMRPASRALYKKLIPHLEGCPVTYKDVQIVDDIYGPNLGSLKGKTVRKNNQPVSSDIAGVPYHVMAKHQNITLAIDVMFINKIPFFITLSRGLHFGTVEAIRDREVSTIVRRLTTIIRLYTLRGFHITVILADPEFEPLRRSFPQLNTCAADEHVPDIERYIRTVKDRTRSTYRMLPFQHVPRMLLVHLVRNSVFWLNAFPTATGISSVHSPRYFLVGYEITYRHHVRLPFGSYAQVHEEHDNRMVDRTTGGICLGPTGNRQGSHWFLSVATGQRLIRRNWTELPMPREVFAQISALGRTQRMPCTLTFADRHGHEILEPLHVLHPDAVSSTTNSSDDSSYHPSLPPFLRRFLLVFGTLLCRRQLRRF